jgi:predicted SprT family Zn-dependent metalloprotease
MTDKEFKNLWIECLAETSEITGNQEISKKWRIKLNGRISRALGRTNFMSREIEMQKDFVRNGTREEIKDTIMHEIAHALVGSNHNHDSTWKAMALKLGALPAPAKQVSEKVAKTVRKRRSTYTRVVAINR